MNEDELLEEESAKENSLWRYFLGVGVALALLSLFTSKYQDLLRMAVWTDVFIGLLMTHALPFLIDALSRIVIALLLLMHFGIMAVTYPRLPKHGFIMMFIVIAIEVVICLLPIAWLDVRSLKVRQKQLL